MDRIGLYAGSFDPVTNGHLDIIARSLNLVDRVIVGIGVSASKKPLFSFDERRDLIFASLKSKDIQFDNRIDVISFSGLLVNIAAEKAANVIIRGLRSAADYDYEAQMTAMNRKMAPEIETIYLAGAPEISFISSSLVRQIASMNGDVSSFVAKPVVEKIKLKYAD
jgi:pantetheine-phosphate adenylyltransferase